MYKNSEFLDYCYNNDFAGVYTCVRNKADLEQIHNEYNNNETGLIIASKRGYLTIVDLLIDSKVNINAKDNE